MMTDMKGLIAPLGGCPLTRSAVWRPMLWGKPGLQVPGCVRYYAVLFICSKYFLRIIGLCFWS